MLSTQKFSILYPNDIVLGFVGATETFRENVGGGCGDRRERLSIPRSDGALHRLQIPPLSARGARAAPSGSEGEPARQWEAVR